MKFVFTVIFSLISLALTFGQYGKIAEVSKESDHNPVETTITINPQNPKNIVASCTMVTKFVPGYSDFTYASTDGGITWTEVQNENTEKRIQGDDGVSYGINGRVYHSYLAFWDSSRRQGKQASSGIFISSSKDGGFNWDRRAVVVDHINTRAPMEDKPYVIADNSSVSKYKNNVYLAWTHFAIYGSHNPADSSQIYFSRSVDSGKTFSSPMRISETGGDCIDSSNTVEGAIAAVGPNGEVFVVWAGPKGIVMTESNDGGETFGQEKVIGWIYHGWDLEVPGIGRANGMPVTKVDNSNSPYRGTIYVNWVDNRYGDPDVFLKYSRDSGKTWSNVIRVNDDKIRNGKYQFFTWMSVDPVDGSINIIFYDRRDMNGTFTGLTLARSVDGGKTFVNYKIDQIPFECNPKIFFGDYIGIDSYNGEVAADYMYFKNDTSTAINCAIFQFKPGTQDIEK